MTLEQSQASLPKVTPAFVLPKVQRSMITLVTGPLPGIDSVDISAFAAFETYTVVIDVHVALADQDVVADIHVNRIGAGAFG